MPKKPTKQKSRHTESKSKSRSEQPTTQSFGLDFLDAAWVWLMQVLPAKRQWRFDWWQRLKPWQQRWLVLGVLLLLAGWTRWYRLGGLPLAFFGDEAALVYNGWSLWLTGRDEWGQWFPLALRSFDDYKPAIYAYLTIPFIWVFDVTQLASRAPAALAGTLLPVLTAEFVWRRRRNWGLAFLVGLGIILSPWHIEISRTAIEAGVALTMFIGALVLLQSDRRPQTWAGWLVILVSLFTYHTARLVVPLLAIVGWLLGGIKRKKSTLIVMIGLMIMGLGLSFTGSSERYKQISVFHSLELHARLMESIREDGGVGVTPLWQTRIFHNRPQSWMWGIADSYLQNTSLTYLFMGGAEPPRTEIPGTGQFLLIMLPFFVWGIALKLRRFDQFDQWTLFWLVLAPGPAALTFAEIPHAYRTLFMLVPMVIVMGEGWWDIVEGFRRRRRFLLPAAALAMTVSISYFGARAWHQYARHQQVHQAWHRQSGYRDMVAYINQLPAEKREEVVITQREMEPYIFILFHNKIDPRIYQALPIENKRLAHAKMEQEGATTWTMFDYRFDTRECPHDRYHPDLSENVVYFVGKTCQLPSGYLREAEILFGDGSRMFGVDRVCHQCYLEEQAGKAAEIRAAAEALDEL